MTLEQLRIFAAVAERQHMTRGAEALNLTQSAVSLAIATLEARQGVKLFHRIGRGIQLTDAGSALLGEARAILDRVAGAERMLADFAGLSRGTLRLATSQTVGGYWLPPILERYHRAYPGIVIELAIANSEQVAEQVADGRAEIGIVEGELDDPRLARWAVAEDEMALVQAEPGPAAIDRDWILARRWVLREAGSGTRSTFEQALAGLGIDPAELPIALVLPSNEAVRTAVAAGAGATVLSTLVVDALLTAGRLHRLPFALPPRCFHALAHKERYRSRAAEALVAMLGRDPART